MGYTNILKNDDLYYVYDITNDEETMKPRVSYISLKDGKKYSRFIERFTEDVSEHP